MKPLDISLVKPKNRVLSARDLDLVHACKAPGVFVLRERERPNFAQWWGIFVGRFLEYAVRYDREYALEYIEEKYPKALNACAAIDIDAIKELKPQVEIELALETERRAAYELKHDEADAAVHVHSRADLVFVSDSGLPHVADYKTGKRKYDPTAMSQTRTLAAKVWLAHDRPEGVDVSIVNVLSTGHLRWTTKTMLADELFDQLIWTRRVHLSVLMARAEFEDEGIEPPRTAGEHCHWCNLKSVCPDAPPEKK